MYECMSSHLTCTHQISILHTHVNVCILPDQAEVVKKGFQMKVRQSSGAGKIVFRAVKNFNNIPHILEIRVFSFTRFLKFPFIVFGGCSSLRFFSCCCELRGLQVSVYEPRTRNLRWVRLTSSERKLLLLTDSNSNVHSWRDKLIEKIRINW